MRVTTKAAALLPAPAMVPTTLARPTDADSPYPRYTPVCGGTVGAVVAVPIVMIAVVVVEVVVVVGLVAVVSTQASAGRWPRPRGRQGRGEDNMCYCTMGTNRANNADHLEPQHTLLRTQHPQPSTEHQSTR